MSDLKDELEDYKRGLAERGNESFLWALAALGMAALVLLLERGRPGLFEVMLLGVAVMFVVRGLTLRRKARTAQAMDLVAEEALIAWEEEVAKQPIKFTYCFIGAMVLTYIAQQVGGARASMEVAGLVKDRVWEGEWWRLLSCALMHANIYHLLMNAFSMLELGRLVETQGVKEDMPIVFSVSVLTGSVASSLLMPSIPSVGASGGIMGLAGYIVALGYLHRERMPAGFRGRLLKSLVVTALVGALGYRYVDNAAHVGGFVGGLIMGCVLQRKRRYGDSGTLRYLLAWGCLGWFAGAAFYCLRRLMKF